MSMIRFNSACSTLAILIAFSREPSMPSWVVTAVAGQLLFVALTSVLALLSSIRGSPVMSMLCLLLTLVFAWNVWRDDIIVIGFLASAGCDFIVVLLLASGSGANGVSPILVVTNLL